jgi:hypothetical protein
MRMLLIVALASACGASVANNGGDDDPTDAPAEPPDGDDDLPDAPVCQKRVVFLSFEGETLTDAATSDATLNRASWMTNGVAMATAPPYRAGSANRAAEIQNIVSDLTARLAPFTTVTTTRPASGDYMMVVFGGQPQAMGSRFIGVQELDCGDLVRNDVAWVGDDLQLNLVANVVMGSIGFGIGLTATQDDTDCMCSWDNTCRYATPNCTLHDGIARDPAALQLCPGAPAIQDEIVAFNAAFCN